MIKLHDDVGCHTGQGYPNGVGDGAGRKTGEALTYWQTSGYTLRPAVEYQPGTGVPIGNSTADGKSDDILITDNSCQGYGVGEGHKNGNCEKDGHSVGKVEDYLEDIRDAFDGMRINAKALKKMLGKP